MKGIRPQVFVKLLALVTSSLFAQAPNVEQREPSLSDVVIACNYLTGFQNVSPPPGSRCAELWKANSTAGVEGIAFSHISYFVQSDIVGNTYGFVRRPNKTLDQSGVPDIGMLFVTDPIAGLQGKVLVIFAQVGPEKTTIFTLDNNLRSSVLYDSSSKSSANVSPPMGSIYQVHVLGPSRFLLQERRAPGTGLSTTSNRAFVLDVSKGEMKLSVAKR